MGSAGKSRGHTKQDMEEDIDADYDRAKDDEEWGGSEKRKHKSTRSKKSGSGEEENDLDGSGRWESSREGNDGRRRSVESIKVGSDEDDYDSRKESYTKQVKKKQEESTLEKLSHWYQDGEFDNKVDGRDKSMGRGHDLFDESERNSSRKSSKIIDHEASRSRSKSKEDRSYDGDYDKSMDQDHKHSERRESNRELDHGSLEQGRSSRKRWDDADVGNKNEESSLTEKSESRSGKILESKSESSRERNTSLKLETREVKGRISESSKGRGKSYDREDIRVDVDGMKSRSRSIAAEEENRAGSPPRGDIPDQERSERHRDNRHTGSDESQERSSYPEDGSNLKRDKGDREAGHSRRSRTPDKRRYNHESLKSEIDYEWNSSLKRKELDKEVYMDDKVKTKDESLTDKNRDREGSRESWKRRQTVSSDKDVDSSYDRDKDWDLPRRGRDRMDNDRPSGRSGNRKDSRGEAVKASSNFGISTENYDVIEIQTKPLDYGRGDLATAFARRDEGSQSDLKTVSNDPQVDLTKTGVHLSVSASNASKDKYMDEGAMLQDQNAWRDDADSQGGRKGQKVTLPARASGSQTSSSSSQPPYGNQESGFSGGRPFQPGGKGGRLGRHSRVRPSGRDNQQVNVHVPLMSPFGPLSMPPPGPIQSLNPNMSPAPGPGMPPGVFIPPFSPPVWPGARAVDLSLLPVSPGMSPLPPGPAGQRFGPNIGTPPNPVMFYNQPGPGRGVPANVSGSGFSAMVPSGRGQSHDKVSGGWVHPKSNAPPGKAPSRGEQNDYSQNFVDTGMRPQNFIRELELTNVEDYPKLRELIQKKDEIVAKASTPPVYYKCDLREFVLSPEFFGTKFDVILIDPPWEEYVHRAAGVADHMESWTFEDIMNLKIEAIADTPSFIFLWVGDGVGLEQGRQCLKKWGFRRCEDICWVKTNKNTATPSLRHDSNTLFQHSKEHCLMGIKGTVRRSTDGHIIHANIDTDVIIAEEPPYGSTQKPDEIYRIIEHFALGRRRLELFGEDHNIRPGWLTVGKGLLSSNFNAEVYMKNFCDKDGKVWQGGGGRNPPPDAPHLVLTTPEIEALRPKSPMKNQQQLQQQSSSISLTAANSSNRKATGNSPQTPNPFGLNQEAASSEHLAPWVQMEGLRGREIGNLGPHDSVLDIYGYNMPPPMLPNGEFLDYETPRSMNML